MDLQDALQASLNNKHYGDYKALPTLIIWGTWLARNKDIFNNVFIPPEIYASKILANLSHFLQDDRPLIVRRVVEEFIDRLSCW